MGLNVNKIIELEDNSKYLLVKKTMYQGSKYYQAFKVDKNNNIDESDITIFKESMSGMEIFVTIVLSNDELYQTLNRIFDAQL